ncbi:type IV pilus biogenesis protein PilM [Legionella brunensis]|uniref:Tfp pilus assembly protein, ATPase PilM n=1 Tax=Legionella brunensis TaxID=29422 RepID=A0A0W0SMG7_9GAMM|nr:type IV pilus assembly protein PilM [Legionella brunensis]KTC84149.1 Tfp pilus assembly protein, ATPase PilM [Legionella brunensis]
MLKRFKSQNRSMIGMDITSLSIHALQITKIAATYHIDNFLSESLDPHVIVDNQIRDQEALFNSIKKLLFRANWSCKSIVLAVPDAAIITKVIQIKNNLPKDEMDEIIFLEASKHFSCPLHEINMDFAIRGPSSIHGNMLDVLITACRAEHVNTRVEAITRAGLTAQVVESESSALERVIPLLTTRLSKEEKKGIAIIHINELFTHLKMAQDGKIIFAHEEASGCNQWGEVLMPQHDNSKEGNYCKMERSITLGEQKSQVIRMEQLIRQIKRMLQFFYSANSSKVIHHLFLAGDTARLPNFCQRLQEKVGIPTSLANPFKEMCFSNNAFSQNFIEKAPSLLIACGLALRE